VTGIGIRDKILGMFLRKKNGGQFLEAIFKIFCGHFYHFLIFGGHFLTFLVAIFILKFWRPF
jgi:hypothetical protein